MASHIHEYVYTYMKTTIEISDALMKRARELAAKRNSTLRAVIASGIRATLKEERCAELLVGCCRRGEVRGIFQ